VQPFRRTRQPALLGDCDESAKLGQVHRSASGMGIEKSESGYPK
jgi:hypothetical protein